jgi:hypothetical protein
MHFFMQTAIWAFVAIFAKLNKQHSKPEKLYTTSQLLQTVYLLSGPGKQKLAKSNKSWNQCSIVFRDAYCNPNKNSIKIGLLGTAIDRKTDRKKTKNQSF